MGSLRSPIKGYFYLPRIIANRKFEALEDDNDLKHLRHISDLRETINELEAQIQDLRFEVRQLRTQLIDHGLEPNV